MGNIFVSQIFDLPMCLIFRPHISSQWVNLTEPGKVLLYQSHALSYIHCSDLYHFTVGTVKRINFNKIS
jgi:hypothetical protein